MFVVLQNKVAPCCALGWCTESCRSVFCVGRAMSGGVWVRAVADHFQVRSAGAGQSSSSFILNN